MLLHTVAEAADILMELEIMEILVLWDKECQIKTEAVLAAVAEQAEITSMVQVAEAAEQQALAGWQ
jgi:hypothetical protein